MVDFKQSRKLTWFCVVSITIVALAGLAVMKSDAITLLNTTVLALAGLPSVFMHVTNKAEVEHKKLER